MSYDYSGGEIFLVCLCSVMITSLLWGVGVAIVSDNNVASMRHDACNDFNGGVKDYINDQRVCINSSGYVPVRFYKNMIALPIYSPVNLAHAHSVPSHKDHSRTYEVPIITGHVVDVVLDGAHAHGVSE